MTRIYDAIPSNGTLVKGDPHTQESFKKLNLSDIVFVDDKICHVVAFDDNKNPVLAGGESVFEIVEESEQKIAEKNHEILFAKSHPFPSASGGLKITAADMSVSSLEDVLEQCKKEIEIKVKINDLDLKE